MIYLNLFLRKYGFFSTLFLDLDIYSIYERHLFVTIGIVQIMLEEMASAS